MAPVRGKGAEERYYNRGMSEDVLDNKARSFMKQLWGHQPKKGEQVDSVGGLTPYEMCRAPLMLDSGQESVQMDLRWVKQDLTCPICLGLLRNTYTTMECMHRFCQDCIVRSLSSSSKECPSCRERLPSKRNLRPDSFYDSLVGAIFPDMEEVEQREQMEAAKIAASFDGAAMNKAVAEGLARQARAAPPLEEERAPEVSPQITPLQPRPAKRAKPEAEVKKKAKPNAAAAAAAATAIAPLPPGGTNKNYRVEVTLTRNSNEVRLRQITLPAVILPRYAPLSVLADIVAKCGAVVPLNCGVVFSLVPPGYQLPVLIESSSTASDLLSRYYGGAPVRLALQYQTESLAAAMPVTK